MYTYCCKMLYFKLKVDSGPQRSLHVCAIGGEREPGETGGRRGRGQCEYFGGCV